MKKKLEAELISIAHRILKLKNKSEVIQLHQETQKLYEILSVLRFYEENFEAVKPTIGLEELEEKLDGAFENKEEETAVAVPEPVVENEPEPVAEEINIVAEPEDAESEMETETEPEEEELIIAAAETEAPAVEPVIETETEDEEEPAEEPIIVAEEEKVVVGQIDIDESELDEEETAPEDEEEPAAPAEAIIEEPVFERVKEEPKQEPKQITLEELLGHSYKEPEFVKVNDVPAEVEKVADIVFEPAVEPINEEPVLSISSEKEAYTRKATGDAHSKAIALGLNDRIAFEKNLFGGSGEDLNRVLSQLNTFDNFEDAQNFIEDLVKPDYNNWEGKEEYATRFMEIVEKRFS